MKKYLPLFILSPLVILFDHLTKYWIVQEIPIGGQISIIPNYFEIVHIRNPGAAFGLFSGWNSPYRNYFFYGVGLIALTALIILYTKTQTRERRMQIPLALILGGAIGNVIDRVFRGNVVDFLRFHYKNEVADFTIFGKHFHFALSWPSFNVADMAITCGAIFLAIVLIWAPQKIKKA